MSTTSVTKLTSFAQACELTGEDPKAKYIPEQQAHIMLRAGCLVLNCKIEPLGWPVNKYTKPLLAHRNLQIIRDAVTGSWEPDWNDSSQYKYYPWFWMNKPGFRFSGSDFGHTGTNASGGSRLCFENREQSDFVGQTCIALYRDLLGAA